MQQLKKTEGVPLKHLTYNLQKLTYNMVSIHHFLLYIGIAKTQQLVFRTSPRVKYLHIQFFFFFKVRRTRPNQTETDQSGPNLQAGFLKAERMVRKNPHPQNYGLQTNTKSSTTWYLHIIKKLHLLSSIDHFLLIFRYRRGPTTQFLERNLGQDWT